MNWKSLREQLVLVLLIGIGAYSSVSLVGEGIANFIDNFGKRELSPLELGLEPAWYETKEWWWKSARWIGVIVGVVALFYAVFLGPWQEQALMLFFLIASLINSRQGQSVPVRIEYERDPSLDYLFLAIFLLSVVGGVFG